MATFIEKIKLLRGLLHGEEARVGPFIAFMEPTRRCNLRCRNCRYHSPQAPIAPPGGRQILDLPSSLAARYLEDLRAMGTRSLVIVGGGEPFLHPHLFDFVAHAKQAGLHVRLVTNGTLLDEKRINALLACPPDQLVVSVWAGTPAEYVWHYPGSDPQNFHRVENGLRLLAATKASNGQLLPEVVLKRVLTRQNYQSLGSLVNLALDAKASRLQFSPLRNGGGRNTENGLSSEEVRTVCRILRDLHADRPGLLPRRSLDHVLTRYGLGEAVWQKLPCYRGWLLTYLQVDGTVRVCSSFNQAMGNLHEDSLPVIWNGPRFRAFRRQTLSLEGLAALGDRDCGFCGFVTENLKVHRLFRWFAFLVRKKPGSFQGGPRVPKGGSFSDEKRPSSSCGH